MGLDAYQAASVFLLLLLSPSQTFGKILGQETSPPRFPLCGQPLPQFTVLLLCASTFAHFLPSALLNFVPVETRVQVPGQSRAIFES